MIHHISIPARDPLRVAAVLAELMNGRDFPFSGPLPGARMAMSGDPHGTMIEVYPETITLAPGTDEAQVVFARAAPADYVGFHALMSVPLGRAEIERIGAREGWRTKFFGRGAQGKPPVFHLLEFWVENRNMFELAPADLLPEYTDYMQIARLDKSMRGYVGASEN
jgi:hypothetical protein